MLPQPDPIRLLLGNRLAPRGARRPAHPVHQYLVRFGMRLSDHLVILGERRAQLDVRVPIQNIEPDGVVVVERGTPGGERQECRVAELVDLGLVLFRHSRVMAFQVRPPPLAIFRLELFRARPDLLDDIRWRVVALPVFVSGLCGEVS